ncbi:MAG: hypothetical protein KGJ09_04020 [Candidatus Omnitrophica bacterium]|nr:hypothetical protein [Candidatus Omnitrophota bacterium]MDE2009227.1 hypothetical protein [Candidatus Omnitrophota bacterium]MDE2230677.1 hypothetical protein [Candidatus Omnitrophota bacterium]
MEAGEVRIRKSFIDEAKTYPEKYAPPKIVSKSTVTPVVIAWKKDLSLGYTQNGGNTKSQLGELSVKLDRKTPFNEFTVKFDGVYSSSNRS